ncbi:MAG: biotin biosynthesis protein BioC [Gammaproteobacteria bacterium]|nr:MAG: biotin biosynthesis protein BioC [Gammaproteobacteria bacterium]
MMASITNQIQDNVNYLMQSIHQQNTHRHITSSPSTNSELISQIKNGQLSASQVHVLSADTQTQGRGQNGRSWQSPKGNVYLSVFYPKYHPLHPLTMPISGLLSLCVGYCLSNLDIVKTLNSHLQTPIGVKWANDIGFYQHIDKLSVNSEVLSRKTLDDFTDSPQAQTIIEFCKLSGVLIEPVINEGNSLGVVVGVGLNVQNAPKLCKITQEGMGYQSISIAELIKKAESKNTQIAIDCPQVADLYRPICKQILTAILCHQYITQPNKNRVLQDFLVHFAKADVLKGRTLSICADLRKNTTNLVEASDIEQTAYTAKALGIDEQGCLQLQKDDGKVMRLFSAKIKVIA